MKLRSRVGADIKAGGKQEGTNSVRTRRKDRGYFVSFSLPIFPTLLGHTQLGNHGNKKINKKIKKTSTQLNGKLLPKPPSLRAPEQTYWSCHAAGWPILLLNYSQYCAAWQTLNKTIKYIDKAGFAYGRGRLERTERKQGKMRKWVSVLTTLFLTVPANYTFTEVAARVRVNRVLKAEPDRDRTRERVFTWRSWRGVSALVTISPSVHVPLPPIHPSLSTWNCFCPFRLVKNVTADECKWGVVGSIFIRCLFPLMKLLFLEMLVGPGKVTEKQNTTIYLTESCLNRVAVNLRFAGNVIFKVKKGGFTICFYMLC